MADIINLRAVRKRNSRQAKEATAEQNRILFGRTKAEKQKQAVETAKAEKHIDAHKRSDDKP